MKIGLLGGSFDPIHMGHLLLAELARETYELDQVIFMPAKLPPHKLDQTLSQVEQRYHMVELAISGNPCFAISDMELQREGPSYTIDSVKALQQGENPATIYFISGADSIFHLETWMTFQDLLKRVVFVGANRPGFSKEALQKKIDSLNRAYGADIRYLDIPYIFLSSTDIRERLYRGGSVRYMIPDVVLQYIEDEGLYRENQRD